MASTSRAVAQSSRRQIVVFDDFRKGEFGVLAPVETADHARSGLWTGNNIVILPDGSLAPQPGPKAQTTTGLSGTAVDLGLGYKTTGPVLWAKMGNQIFQSGAGPTFAFAANTGTSADSLSYIDRVASSVFTYAVNSSGVVESINHGTGAIAALAGSPPSSGTICQFNDRLMLGGSLAANANRLYFSAAGNFTSWPAANFIDVGDGSPIVALIVCRGFLLIAKAGGFDDTWWALRGTPGVNAVLRRISRFQGPAKPSNLALTNDNRVVFSVAAGANGTGNTETVATFDGSSRGTIDSAQIGLLSDTSVMETLRLVNDNDLLIKNQLNNGLMRRKAAYTRFLLDSVLFVNESNFGARSRSMVADPTGATLFLMNHAGTAFYKWHPYATRPAFDADTDGDSATATSPRFTLPEWRVADGSEVCVQAVVVAFRKWNVGSGSNTFVASVYATGTPTAGLTTTNIDCTFTEASSAATVTGDQARFTQTIAPVWGNGFIVSVGNMRGVAIQSVMLVCETRPITSVS